MNKNKVQLGALTTSLDQNKGQYRAGFDQKLNKVANGMKDTEGAEVKQQIEPVQHQVEGLEIQWKRWKNNVFRNWKETQWLVWL